MTTEEAVAELNTMMDQKDKQIRQLIELNDLQSRKLTLLRNRAEIAENALREIHAMLKSVMAERKITSTQG